MTPDNVLQLQQPLKDGGIRTSRFFNGRLLTGKDLSREQEARREADRRVGRAIGDGVAFGLEVARDSKLDLPSAPVVSVSAGLAVNRNGRALRLEKGTSVALTRRFDAATADCLFDDCKPIGGGVYVSGAGVYVLTIAPAQATEGRAQTNGLDPANVACNTDAFIEGVQFRLLPVNQQLYLDLDITSRQFRNRLAYRCFGIDTANLGTTNPWGIEDLPQYGLLDQLRSTGLSDCDVPLALVYWTTTGIQFIDMWAVRRRLIEPDPVSGLLLSRDPRKIEEATEFSYLTRPRRRAEAYAMCAQFQNHMADLAKQNNPTAVIATDYFRYLPPFGVVPLPTTPLPGFSEAIFFTGLGRRPPPGFNQQTPFIDARLLGALQELALDYAPTDVTQKEFVWVYRPWQNVKAKADQKSVRGYVVFASGLMPNLAVARFDMARWDYSNYANCCGGS